MPKLSVSRVNTVSPKKLKSFSSGDSYSVDFDGDDDNLSTSLDLSPVIRADLNWAIAAWVNVPDVTSSSYILSAGTLSTSEGSSFRVFRFSFGTNDKPSVGFYIPGTGWTSATHDNAVTNDSWTLVTAIFEASSNNVTLGIDNTTVVKSFGIDSNVLGANARIGAFPTGTASEIDGKIASIAIFNDEITTIQRTAMVANSGFNMAGSSNCIHWWRMGDGVGDATPSSGDTIVDQVGDYNATLEGNSSIVSGAIQ